jgi:hypothetical protein
MRLKQDVSYEDVVEARARAVELTDRYHASSAEDPRRGELWADVVRQTEHARRVLQTWLDQEGDRARV